VPKEVSEHFREAIKRGAQLEKDWDALVKKYEKAHGDLGKTLQETRKNKLPEGWEKSLPKFDSVEAKATRAYSGEVINAIADAVPQLIGGSADLAPSNNTMIKSSADFQVGQYQNRNIHFGIREHAMGATMNGMALYGSVIPFGGTFQTFSDYMRPAIRLAALSGVQTIFVFTHDSIGLGEDGPTHQSVEHLAALRAIPKLAVIRPCDAHETREAWRAALERDNAPTAFAYSRQKVAVIDRVKFADAKGLHKGAYILAEAETKTGRNGSAEIDLDCHRFGSRFGDAGARAIKFSKHSDARRLDAVLGIFRRANREIQRIRFPVKHTSASGNRSGRVFRLGKIRRTRRRHADG
jgi:transketolase